MMNKPSYVLIVDDNEAIKKALTWLFEFEDYTVVTADNGRDALSFIEKNEPPTAIILDLMMPIMDGYEFRKIYLTIPALSGIPIAIISARKRAELIIELQPNEFFFEKPFDINLLLTFIKENTLLPIQ